MQEMNRCEQMCNFSTMMENIKRRRKEKYTIGDGECL